MSSVNQTSSGKQIPAGGDTASRRAAFQAAFPNSGVPSPRSPASNTPSPTSSTSDRFDEIVMNGVGNGTEKAKSQTLDFSYKNLPVSNGKVVGGNLKCGLM